MKELARILSSASVVSWGELLGAWQHVSIIEAAVLGVSFLVLAVIFDLLGETR